MQEPWGQVDAFEQQVGGLDFPVLLDLNGNVSSSYDFSSAEAYAPFPRQFVIDQNGIIQYMAAQYYPDAVEDEIEALLANPPAAE